MAINWDKPISSPIIGAPGTTSVDVQEGSMTDDFAGDMPKELQSVKPSYTPINWDKPKEKSTGKINWDKPTPSPKSSISFDSPKNKEISWGDAAKAAGSEFQAATDTILSTPSFLVEGLTGVLLPAGEAIKGTKDPFQTAEKKMQGFQESKLGKVFSLSTGENIGNKQGVDESAVMEVFNKLTDKLTAGSEKVAGKGTEGAAAIRLATTALMAGSGALGAIKGKAITKAAKDKLLLNKEIPKDKDPAFESTRIKKDETVGEGLKRNRDRKDQEFLAKTPKELIDDSHTLAYQDAVKAKSEARRAYLAMMIGPGDFSPDQRLGLEKDILSNKNNLTSMLAQMDHAYKTTFESNAPKHLEALNSKQQAISRRRVNEQLTNERLGVTSSTVHDLLPTEGSIAAFNIAEEHISKTELDPAKATVESLKAIQDHPSLSPVQQAIIKAQIPILEENIVNPPIKGVNQILLAKSGHDAVLITKNGLFANEQQAVARGQAITKAVPEVEIRQKITMAMDSDNPFHQLKTDAQKAEDLTQLGRSITNYHSQLHEANNRPMVETRFNPSENAAITAANKERWDHLQLIKHTLADKIEKARMSYQKLAVEPSEEHAISVKKDLDKRLEDLHAMATKFGILDTKIKNYVPHILDWSGFKGTEAQKLSIMQKIQKVPEDPRIKQDSTIQRQYASIGDLQKVLEGTGVKVERDISKIMETYEKNIYAAAAHKQLVEYAKVTKASDGSFLIKPNSAKIHGDRYVAFDGVGSKALEGMLVHPEFKTILGHVFRQTDPGMIARGLSAVNSAIKSNNVFGSLFHFTTLGVAHITERPSTLLHPIATIKAMNKAIENFKTHVGEDQTNLLLKDGGLIVGTDDSHTSLLMNQAATVDKYLSMLSDTHDSHIIQSLAKYPEKLVQGMNKLTWEFAHTGSKLHLANTILTDMIARNPTADPKVLAREVSAHVNTVFGGLNWTDIAAATHAKMLEASNPLRKGALKGLSYVADKVGSLQGRERLQWLLFAPDWTVSAFRSVSDAIPHSMELKEGVKGIINPRTRADLARRYIINASIGYVTVLNAINMAFNNGTPIWENEDPTKISLGDGRFMQVAKHMMEFIEWMRHPEDTAGNKLAFFPKAISILAIGKTNPLNDKSKIKDDSALNRILEVGKSALPFAIGGAIQAPEGSKISQAASSFIGILISGQKKRQFEDKQVLKDKSIKNAKRRAEKERKQALDHQKKWAK